MEGGDTNSNMNSRLDSNHTQNDMLGLDDDEDPRIKNINDLGNADGENISQFAN